MKLPFLLTQFLYKNKKLSLPGIGNFTLDPAVIIPDEHNKDIHIPAHGIEFQRSTSHVVDDELIEYIKAHTGKMKPLALADLESYLTLGTELLNIGKPFYLEGIGTLTKDKDGKFEFQPGEFSPVKQEEGTGERHERPSRKKPPAEIGPAVNGIDSNRTRKILLTLGILAGLLIIAWGGYLMYRRNAPPEKAVSPSVVQADTTLAKGDSTARLLAISDSTHRAHPGNSRTSLTGDSIQYKFVILRTHDKARALRRYNQLLSYDLKAFLETKDSSYFKVYFSFPSVPKDTVHIKDSLLRVYAHLVTIER